MNTLMKKKKVKRSYRKNNIAQLRGIADKSTNIKRNGLHAYIGVEKRVKKKIQKKYLW